MPPKVRQLKATLSKAGFFTRPGKGSHTVWYHPGFPVTISGNDGRDAQPYQIKDVQDALQRLRRKK